jgi:hypothetical protein
MLALLACMMNLTSHDTNNVLFCTALGAVWSAPFFEVLLVGGVATFVDIRVISGMGFRVLMSPGCHLLTCNYTVDCAIRVSFYATFGFYMLIPVFTIVICALIFLAIFLVKAWLIPFLHRSETQVGKYEIS